MTPEETIFWTKTMLDNGISGDIARRMLMKMVKGSLKYGNISDNLGTRDLKLEIQEELLDAANYCIIKLYENPGAKKEAEFKDILKDLTTLITKIRKN